MRYFTSFFQYGFNPFPSPGIPSTRPSGPSNLRPAVGSAPGVVRTRPVAPRDRGSKRKVAVSGLGSRFGRPGPPGLDGGCPADSRLQACSAGEPWHQFVRSGCRAGKRVLSYGRTPVPGASGRLRCLVGSNVLSFFQLKRRLADRRRLDRGTAKSRATLLFASEWVRVDPRSRRWPRSSQTRRPMSATFTSGGREELSRTSKSR